MTEHSIMPQNGFNEEMVLEFLREKYVKSQDPSLLKAINMLQQTLGLNPSAQDPSGFLSKKRKGRPKCGDEEYLDAMKEDLDHGHVTNVWQAAKLQAQKIPGAHSEKSTAKRLDRKYRERLEFQKRLFRFDEYRRSIGANAVRLLSLEQERQREQIEQALSSIRYKNTEPGVLYHAKAAANAFNQASSRVVPISITDAVSKADNQLRKAWLAAKTDHAIQAIRAWELRMKKLESNNHKVCSVVKRLTISSVVVPKIKMQSLAEIANRSFHKNHFLN